MKKVLLCFSLLFLAAVSSAQDSLPDTMNVVKGSLNISVNAGRNSGNNTAPETGLVAPGVLVGNVYIGYQYRVGKKWGVNTALGIGYQPFRFRTVDEASKTQFNETTFMMPYFGLQLQLKRSILKSIFFSLGINIHVNTLAEYNANYTDINNRIESFEKLSLERSLTEYSAVQQGLSFQIGKEITEGQWSGIDLYFTANLLTRNKLVIDYEVTKASNSSLGKVRYNGGFIGFGVCYNFTNY